MTELEKLNAARAAALDAYNAAHAARDAARDAYYTALDAYNAALAAQEKEPTDD